MGFPPELRIRTCRCVAERGEPVLCVTHANGEWQMYCHWDNHAFGDERVEREELVVATAGHLVALDPTLDQVADLPVDMGAERSERGFLWSRFDDSDLDDDDPE